MEILLAVSLVIILVISIISVATTRQLRRLMERKEKIIVSALASIASNLGRGSIRPSEMAEGADPLRRRATEALHESGYDYYEDVGKERKDGWFTKEEIKKAK